MEESKHHSYLQEGQEGEKYRLVSLTSVPGKVMEQLILEAVSNYIKDMKVTERWIYKGEIILN